MLTWNEAHKAAEQRVLGEIAFRLSPSLGACVVPVAHRLKMTSSVLKKSKGLSAFHKIRSISLRWDWDLYFKESTEEVERLLGEAVRRQLVNKDQKRMLGLGQEAKSGCGFNHTAQLPFTKSSSTWEKTVSIKCVQR